MKFGPVTKLDKRNKKMSKKIHDDAMSETSDVIDIFPIYGQFGAIRKGGGGNFIPPPPPPTPKEPLKSPLRFRLNSMLDELKELKYFKKITDFKSLIM